MFKATNKNVAADTESIKRLKPQELEQIEMIPFYIVIGGDSQSGY